MDIDLEVAFCLFGSFCVKYLGNSGKNRLHWGGGDLKARFLCLELQEVSGSAASLEATQNSAGRRQSQPISFSAAVPGPGYKAEDERETTHSENHISKARRSKRFFQSSGSLHLPFLRTNETFFIKKT